MPITSAPGGHGVAAELVDEPWMTGGDAVERISNVDARDGARRPAQTAILGPRKSDHRPMQSVFDPPRHQPDDALVPGFIE